MHLGPAALDAAVDLWRNLRDGSQALCGLQSRGDILETGRGLREQAQWIEGLNVL